MKLDKKKSLAARALGVGSSRIRFSIGRIDEIKDAITKQDVKDLAKSGAISIKEIKGKRKIKKRKTRRRAGSVKKKVNKRKENYMIITRKLRTFVLELKKKGILDLEEYRTLRKEIRLHEFKSLAQMKDRIKTLKEKDK